MIGNVNRKTGGLGRGFKGLLSYLETGKDGKQTDRIDWVESRNLGTARLDVAGRIMAATARESVRTEKPVFHFSISFAPEDGEVTREMMRSAADGVLRDLELDKHQVLIVAHKDTGNAHMHVVVNRVHPDEHRAWRPGHSKRRIEAAMRRQEVRLGLRIVPGRLAPVPGRDGSDRPEPAPRLQRGDAAFLADVKNRAGPVFERARSWAELESGLAEVGLRVRMNGRGMSVTDGVKEVKASEVKAAFSRGSVEKRFGTYSSYRARVAVADSPPAPSRTARPAAERSAPGAESAAPHSGRNAGDAGTERAFWKAYGHFNADLRRVYENPVDARRALLRHADKSPGGPSEALETLRSRPEAFGKLKDAPDAQRGALIDRAAKSGAAFVQARADRPRPTLKELDAKTQELLNARKRAGNVGRTADAAGRAKSDRALSRERYAYRRATIGAAREALSSTYSDPDRVMRRIWREVREHGAEAVGNEIRTRPERFGELRGEERRRFGFWRELDTSAARASAGRSAQAVETAAAAIKAAPTRKDLRELDARVERTQREHSAARSAAAAGPSPRVLEAQVGALMQKAAAQAQRVASGTLGPIVAGPQKLLEKTGVKHIQQLAMMVKAPQLAVARAAWDLAQKLARGDQGRDGSGHGEGR